MWITTTNLINTVTLLSALIYPFPNTRLPLTGQRVQQCTSTTQCSVGLLQGGSVVGMVTTTLLSSWWAHRLR